MIAPAFQWTPAEAWLMAGLATRALVATLDGDAPIHGVGGRFRIARDGNSDLLVELDADRAELALDLSALGGQRWRTGWRLEVSYLDDPAAVLGTLGDAGVRVAIGEPRRRLRVALRVLRRQVEIALDGEAVAIPIAEVSSFCYTRQSTSSPEPTGPAAPARCAWSAGCATPSSSRRASSSRPSGSRPCSAAAPASTGSMPTSCRARRASPWSRRPSSMTPRRWPPCARMAVVVGSPRTSCRAARSPCGAARP